MSAIIDPSTDDSVKLTSLVQLEYDLLENLDCKKCDKDTKLFVSIDKRDATGAVCSDWKLKREHKQVTVSEYKEWKNDEWNKTRGCSVYEFAIPWEHHTNNPIVVDKILTFFKEEIYKLSSSSLCDDELKDWTRGGFAPFIKCVGQDADYTLMVNRRGTLNLGEIKRKFLTMQGVDQCDLIKMENKGINILGKDSCEFDRISTEEYLECCKIGIDHLCCLHIQNKVST